MSDLPILGASLSLEEFDTQRSWVFDKQRDLELTGFFMPDALGTDISAMVVRAKDLLKGYRGRLGIHGPAWGFNFASHDPAIRDVIKDRMRQALGVCEEIGATQMVIHSPYTYWDFHNIDKADGERQALIERVHACLSEAIRRAEEIGCVLVFENIEDRDPADRVILADSFQSDAVAVSLDTGHAHFASCSFGAPPVDYYVKAAGKHLQHVHLQDGDGYADRHWTLGEGTIAWPAVFGALTKLGGQPRLIIEISDVNRLQACTDYLSELELAQ